MDIDPNTNTSFTTAFPYPGNIYNSNSNGNSSLFVQQHQQQLSVPLGYSGARGEPVFGLIIPGCPIRTDFQPIIDTPGIPATKYSLNLSCISDLNNVPILSITDLVLFVTSSSAGGGVALNGSTGPASPMNQELSSLPIPPDFGVLCYWQITQNPQPNVPAPECTGFALFGALTSTQLSAVYRTGWSEHEQLVNMVQQSSSQDLILTIGLSIEPIQNVQNLIGTSVPSIPSPIFQSSSTMYDVGGIINTATNSNTTSHRLNVAQKIALDLFHFMKSFDSNGGSGSSAMMTVPNNVFDRWYQRFENRYRRDPNFFLKNNE